MKQLTRRFIPLFLSLILILSAGMTAFASGEGNLDGGGGGMGSGTATDVWHNQDGVRVTVATADGSAASTPFDISNFSISGSILHFGKVSKLQYSGGASLSLDSGSYVCSRPGTPLPRIISGGHSRASIEAIRRYFCSEYAEDTPQPEENCRLHEDRPEDAGDAPRWEENGGFHEDARQPEGFTEAQETGTPEDAGFQRTDKGAWYAAMAGNDRQGAPAGKEKKDYGHGILK